MQRDSLRLFFHNFVIYINSLIHNLEITYFLIAAIVVLVYGFYVYKLAFLLFRNKIIAYFGVFLVLFGSRFALASHDLLYGLEPATVAMGLVPMILYYFFKNRLVFSFILLGVATLIHLQLGIHLFLILLLFLVLTKSIFSKEKIKSLFLSLVSYFIVCGYLIIPYFLNSIHAQQYPSDLIIKIIKFRVPWHFFPLTWTPLSYILFFLFMAVVIYELYLYNKENPDLAKKIGKLFLIIFSFLIGAFVFIELVPIKFVIFTQLFRMSIYLILFGFLLIARHIYSHFQESNILQKIFYCLLIFSLFYNFIPSLGQKLAYFFIVLVGIYLIFIFVQEKFQRNIFEIIYHYFSIKKRLIWLICFVVFLIAGLYFFKNLINFHPKLIFFFLRQKINYSAWITFLALMVLTYFLLIKKRFIWQSFVISLLLLAFLSVPIQIINAKKITKEPAIISFIKNQTTKDAIFLTPPVGEDYRYFAERAIVVDFKGFSIDQAIMVDWYQRMLDIGNFDKDPGSVTSAEIQKGYQQLTEKKILGLKTKYHIDYAIFKKDKKLNFPKVYKDKQNIIYRIAD